MTETKKKFVGPFSFCTKHPHSFYASCKCPIPGMKKVKDGEIVIEEENKNGELDV